ncbi:LOW QUALITY PROTEIN: regulation of nuclear pre-mRNA domain-containing protein 2a [Conger conger]|uniref:LOW QUALITY PROTEIN: regulation of nuclear pre-mRNA domain-containing protein 2a n=1 Tax=Conger conger TaxID=82655 RepID=UPI002A5ACDAD|nr:LOW QUALITY PROTEIN: regulation of nuclear pre-mRNA domain-containing protein 2a [Conger conger]
MAAGTGAASGHTGRGSSAALQSSLDRRFQGVSNTMESIQGLSNWCIENKKYHTLIVRYWMKWMKKSAASHRLNLFYVANDVIQNCKRKNAIIYRTAFSEVLPEAARLIKDSKVRRSVERILTIWEERSVYPEELISELKAGLARKAPPSAQSSAPPNPKAALKSKILAEFAPQAFIEKLSQHSRSLEDTELKEKQLAALRVDVCSTEALKRLKDKAGGKKFSKDFEEGSTKLQDFVGFLEKQLKGGPPLLEALSNADVFYEMQYKEVKIIANAYKTFANRVTHLKRKLDALKSTLPGLDDSPVPSPSEDAPSPTGSESPFHGMGAVPDTHLDGRAMDGGTRWASALGDVPSPLSSPGASPLTDVPHGEKDNRDVEDMELSEGEETGSPGIIVEEQVAKPAPIPEPDPATVPAKPLLAHERNPVKQSPPPMTPASPVTSVSPETSATTAAPVTPATPATPAPVLPVNLANVDLGKISSILSSLTSAMKNTGVSPVSRTSPGTPGTPSAHSSALKSPAAVPGGAAPGPNPLASILSRVDISPESLLSVLSKTQSPGLQGMSLLQSVAGGSSGPGSAPQPASTVPPRGLTSGPAEALPVPLATPEERAPAPAVGPDGQASAGLRLHAGAREEARERAGARVLSPRPSFPSSLESKLHKFLQGNPGFRAFNLGLSSGDGQGSSSNSPFLPAENLDGTPVRDEAPGTPTQDEMDEPGPVANPAASSHNGGIRAGLNADPASLDRVKNLPLSSTGLGPAEFGRRDGHSLSPTAYRSESWGAPNSPPNRYGEGGPNRQEFRHLDAMSGPRDVSQDGYGSDLGTCPAGWRISTTEGVKEQEEREEASQQVSTTPSAPSQPGDCLKSGGEANPLDGSGGGEGGEQAQRLAARRAALPAHQTLVSPSSCGEGTPVGILGYNRPTRPSGERIQTVESIRVIGRGMRPHGRGGETGPRPSLGRGGGWYGEAYAEGAGAHPRNPGPGPHGRPDDDSRQAFPFEERGRVPYPGRDPHPPRHPAHIPPSDFFSSPPPPIPPPPPPPIPQLPPPPKDFPGPPSSVMVGGVLVPVDRPLSQPPSRGGEREERSGPVNSTTPPALFKDLPHHGAVKDHFPSRQGPPLHRPGSSGPHPSLLGRVREGPSPPPSSLPLPSPPLETSHLPPNQHPPRSPPPHLHGHRQPPSPILRPPHPDHRAQLRPPHHQPRPHMPPLSHRPPLRGHHPRPPHPAHFDHEPPFRGGKRPGPHFSGPPRGGFGGSPFYPPKRPYLPPRY